MKIGVYGGTFNPPHLGHLAAARAVCAALRLDRLLLIPDHIPPHKPLPEGSPSAAQRLWMTQRMSADLSMGDAVQTLDLELQRSAPSYTSDTLTILHEQYPDAELWLLMGADMFQTLDTWHEPEKILSLAGIAAFARTEGDVETLLGPQRTALYHKYPAARIFTLAIPDVLDISSTTLRSRLAAGSGGEKLSPAVYGYILREGLYNTHADLQHLSLEQLRPVALSYLNPQRVPHVLGTEQAAIRLALRYGADETQARRAALLHDCTKRLSLDEQLALCQQYRIPLDPLEQQTLKLLHAKTGAAIARTVFGEEEAVCTAIQWHTTGHANMTLLEKIIYLADYIEPTRDFPGVHQLRTASEQSLDEGIRMGLKMTMEEMAERNAPVHPDSLDALRDLERNVRQ